MKSDEDSPLEKFESLLGDLIAVPKKAVDEAIEKMKPLRQPREQEADEPEAEA